MPGSAPAPIPAAMPASSAARRALPLALSRSLLPGGLGRSLLPPPRGLPLRLESQPTSTLARGAPSSSFSSSSFAFLSQIPGTRRSSHCLQRQVCRWNSRSKGGFIPSGLRASAFPGVPVGHQRRKPQGMETGGSRALVMGAVGPTAVDDAEREVLVQHIVVGEGEAQQGLVEELKKRIKNGEDMAALAQEHSLCPSRQRGGVLGWISLGRTAPEFEAAAFEAEVGEVVQAQTRHGVHLLRVLEDRRIATVLQVSVEEFEAARLAASSAGNGLSPAIQLVDVREPHEINTSSIPGFQRYPLSQFQSWAPSVAQDLDPQVDTFVLCHHGMRSQQVAQFLVSQGFQKVFNITGGIDAYSLLVDNDVPRY